MRISAQVSSMPPSSMFDELVQLVQRWLDSHLTNHDEALTEYLHAACR
jgi:hemerythrin